jgi:ABC-type antimicrobial peptide transport system permease subunit
MISTILVCFALLGLFLAAIGLYGVIAHLVARRTMEIGVRVALGAQARDVLWMVLRSGLRLTLIGTGIGLLGAVVLRYGIAAALSQPTKFDPVLVASMTAVLLLVGFVGLIACWFPARRATKVDPMVALRAE